MSLKAAKFKYEFIGENVLGDFSREEGREGNVV